MRAATFLVPAGQSGMLASRSQSETPLTGLKTGREPWGQFVSQVKPPRVGEQTGRDGAGQVGWAPATAANSRRAETLMTQHTSETGAVQGPAPTDAPGFDAGVAPASRPFCRVRP